MRKLTIILALVMFAMISVAASAADLKGELGILDLKANGGINPNTGVAWKIGDQYRLAFYTAGKIDATSNDPAVYDAFAASEAAAAGLGGSWTAMVWVNTDGTLAQGEALSSPAERSGTGDLTDGAGIGGAGVPVYAMDGSTCIARNNADIYNSWSNPFDGDAAVRLAAGTTNLNSDGQEVTASQNVHYSPFLNQYGLGDSANVHGVDCWTGGFGSHVNALGDTIDNDNASTGSSNANNTGRVWNRFTHSTTSNMSVYAISEPLTVMDAYASQNVYPEDGDDKVAPDAAMILEWINPDPNGAGSVYADVYFGTDPCALTPVVTDPVDGLDVTTAVVDASVNDTYYWRVDITVGDANAVQGDIWSFTTVGDVVPVVTIDPQNIMTWSDKAVQLDATIDDNGEGDVTFIWTASPDGIDNDDLTVDFVATDEDPVVTVTNNTGSMVTVTMTLTATDANGDVEKSSIIEVYNDACDMTLNGENVPVAPTDLNADCKTDIADLAIMAASWLDDYASTEPK